MQALIQIFQNTLLHFHGDEAEDEPISLLQTFQAVVQNGKDVLAITGEGPQEVDAQRQIWGPWRPRIRFASPYPLLREPAIQGAADGKRL